MYINLQNTHTVENEVQVTGDHFGVNVVTVHDTEFADPSSPLNDFVDSMAVTNLRFPGGSTTEYHFDMTNPDAAWSAYDAEMQLTPMNEFFIAAGTNEFSVTLVLPTKRGFAQTSGEAMIEGVYGARTEFTDTYLSDIVEYIDYALSLALENEVEITALEIGNEFWGSGEMTPHEYGLIAGKVAVRVQEYLDNVGQSHIAIIAQTTSSSSIVYSPRDDINVYIDPEGNAFNTAYVNEHYGGEIPHDWVTATVPGQGSARQQVIDIASGINATDGAAAALDGIVQHAYFSGGLDRVDTSKEFMFGQWKALEVLLDRDDNAPNMLHYLTEWNTDSRESENNRGLEHASMMIETFYQVVKNGITNAHIWPLTFNFAQGISLVDLGDERLSIAGEMYKLMAESLPGTAAAIDFEVSGTIDIHGFDSSNRDVFFVSERSGEMQEGVTINFSNFVDAGESVFVTVSELWDGATVELMPKLNLY